MGLENSAENSNEVLDLIRESFPAEVLETSLPHGDATVRVAPEALAKILTFLKNDERLRFNVLVDLTAVDHLGSEPRFEVVYRLLSVGFNRRLCVKVRVGGEEPELESVTHIWKSADWLEREVWDMFGIRFTGHPGLKRILLYEEFQGHPLRKDYPIHRRQPLIGPKN